MSSANQDNLTSFPVDLKFPFLAILLCLVRKVRFFILENLYFFPLESFVCLLPKVLQISSLETMVPPLLCDMPT